MEEKEQQRASHPFVISSTMEGISELLKDLPEEIMINHPLSTMLVDDPMSTINVATTYAAAAASVGSTTRKEVEEEEEEEDGDDDRSCRLRRQEQQGHHTRRSVGVCSSEISSQSKVDRISDLRRKRTSKMHSIAERRRRERIKEKIEQLQKLVPNSTKMDRASILDEAITYMKFLQQQVQMFSGDDGRGFLLCQTPYLQALPAIQCVQTMPRIPQFLPVGVGIGMPRLVPLMPTQHFQFFAPPAFPSTSVTNPVGFPNQPGKQQMQSSITDCPDVPASMQKGGGVGKKKDDIQ